MRSNILLAIMILFFISACATNKTDQLISGKIERVWSSNTTRYAEIIFNNKYLIPNHISFTISEEMFGSLNPVSGDCVKIWFKQFNNSSIPYGNMNIVPCY